MRRYDSVINFNWLITPKTRFNHWSNSKFADWLKKKSGIDIPVALSYEEWKEYYRKFKNDAPATYYFIYSVLPSIQNLCYLPADIIHSIFVYYSNAIKNKVHYLKTGLPVGNWYDSDLRMLCANMNALIDFVEIELAHLCTFSLESSPDIRADFYHYGRSQNGGQLYLKEKCEEEYECQWIGTPDEIEEDRIAFENRRQIYKDMSEIYYWWKEYFKKAILNYEIEIDSDLEDKYLKRLIELRHFMWT